MAGKAADIAFENYDAELNELKNVIRDRVKLIPSMSGGKLKLTCCVIMLFKRSDNLR